MLPTVSLFGVTAQSYAVALLLAVWVGLWMSARGAHRLGVAGEQIYSLGFYAVLTTLLGARLAFVARHCKVAPDPKIER